MSWIDDVKDVSEEANSGQLDTKILTSIPSERLEKSSYKFQMSLKITDMPLVDAIMTALYIFFLYLSWLSTGITGASVFLLSTTAVSLYACYLCKKKIDMYKREDAPFSNAINNGEYEISSPYIKATTERAHKLLKPVILYTHMIYKDSLYKSLSKSSRSFCITSILIVLFGMVIVIDSGSLVLFTCLCTYILSRIIYEYLRLRFLNMMLYTLSFIRDFENDDDEGVEIDT